MRTLFPFCTALGVLIASPHLLADDTDNGTTIRYESVSTSDDLDRNSLSLGYQGGDANSVRYGLDISGHRLQEKNAEYKANAYSIHADRQINDMLFFEGGIGQDRVKQQNGNQSRQLTTWHARGEAKLGEKVTVGLQKDRNFTYRDQLLTSGDGSILSAETVQADIQMRTTRRVRLEAKTARRKYSDGNRSTQHKLGAFYGISPDWPWVWAGVEAEQIDFDQQNEGYWTPENHRAVTAKFMGNFPVSDNTDIGSEISLGRGKEANAAKAGTTYSAAISANTKITDNSKLSAEAHYIKSQQTDNDWNETGASLGLTFSHY